MVKEKALKSDLSYTKQKKKYYNHLGNHNKEFVDSLWLDINKRFDKEDIAYQLVKSGFSKEKTRFIFLIRYNMELEKGDSHGNS